MDSSAGQPPSGAVISLIYKTITGSSDSFARSSVYNLETGAFELRNVPSGEYILQAVVTQVSMSPGGVGILFESDSGRTPLAVTNSDVSGVVVTTSRGISINGKITVEGLTQTPDPGRLLLRLQPSIGGILSGDLNTLAPAAADGTFHIDGVASGEYRFDMAGMPANYYIKEIRYGGREALNNPMIIAGSSTDTLEVVLSPRVANIEGTVTDGNQQAVQGIQAVLVPDQHRDRYELFRAVTTDQNGHFRMGGLPPGDYRIFAWESIEPFGFFDPDLLKRDESRGQQLSIRESDNTIVNVKMIPSGLPVR